MAAFRSAVMVGRGQELDRLRQVVAAVERAEPAFVVIEGEPGVGKTRLAEELTGSLDSAVILTGHGMTLPSGELPFGVLSEVLRDLARAVGISGVRAHLADEVRALAGLLPALADSGTEAEGPPVDRVALFGATAGLLQRVAEDRLVVVFVDDLQWVDDESLDIIEYVGRVSHGCRLLVLATVRTGDAGGDQFAGRLADLHKVPGHEIIALGRLNSRDVAEQVRHLVSRAVDAAEVSRIVQLSDGVPFFVEELTAAGGMEGRALPVSVQRLVLARLPELSEDGRDVLDALAVGEGHSDHRPLMLATEMDRVRIEAATTEAVEVGILELTEDGRGYRFRHVLLREALGEVMHPGRRIHWHHRWARILTNDHAPFSAAEATIMAAQHWHAAGDREMALASAIEAARASALLDGPGQEADFWQRAFALWPADTEQLNNLSRGEVAVRLIRARELAWQIDEALDWCRSTLLNRVDDKALELWLRLNEQCHSTLVGEPEVRFVTAGTAAGLIERLASMGCSWPVMDAIDALWELFPERLGPLFGRVDELLVQMSRELGDDGMIREVMRHRISFALQNGRADEALRHATDQVDHARSGAPMDLRIAEVMLMSVLLAQGLAARAVDIGTAALRTFTEPDAAPHLWRWLARELGRGLFALGRHDEAQDLIHHAGQMAAPESSRRPMRGALQMRIDARMGDLPAAMSLLEDLSDAGPPLFGEEAWSWYRIGHADLAFVSGDLSLLQPLRPFLGERWLVYASAWTWELLLNAMRAATSPLARHGGQPGQALEFAEACDRLHRHGDLGQAWSLEVAALRGRAVGTDSTDEWAAAANAWQHIGYRFDEAVCRFRLGEALLRDGYRQEAAEQLSGALGVADALDATPLQEAIGHTARLARLRLAGDTSTRRPGAAPLTERESEVLALVAQGRTNEQIAETLVISPKTASVHVSRIITKLRAGNRTEAAALARNLGLVE